MEYRVVQSTGFYGVQGYTEYAVQYTEYRAGVTCSVADDGTYDDRLATPWHGLITGNPGTHGDDTTVVQGDVGR